MTKPCAEKERSEAVQAAEGVTQRLEEMKLKIAKLSEGIIERIDHMGNRIDDLECTIADLMAHASAAEQP